MIVTERIELRAVNSTVSTSKTHQVNRQAQEIRSSQSANFGASTGKDRACPDKNTQNVWPLGSKRRLETIIGSDNAHKTGIRSVRKNTTESYNETTQADQLSGFNSSSNDSGRDPLRI